MADPEPLLELAVAVAEEAGQLLLDCAGARTLEVTTKSSDTDPVSEADRAAERLITGRLHAARPDDAVVGEESAADRRGTTGLTWVVDPLDGTVNFLYGIPHWCVSVACEDGEGALVGVVHDPTRGETFAARRGGGTRLNGRRVSVSAVTELRHALVATGFSYEPEVRVEQAQRGAQLIGRCRDIRRFGAAALDLAWVAAGRYDGFYEFGLAHWDWAAGTLLVEEAGGATSHRQVRFAGDERPGVFAGGRAVHDALAAFMGGLNGGG